jgi:4-diphosphocytidyl-2-C-methyl-D-erythritol kinase
MISFPHCKINLGLHVIHKREDGFHNIESVFYPVNWCDVLEIIEGGSQPFDLTISGLEVKGDPEKNLCYKAWKLLSNDFKLPNLRVYLHKVLPMGAGLGGGSSDAAFTLKMINELCNLGLSTEKLVGYAAQIGSDCAFFIHNQPMLATGKGEILVPFDVNLSGYKIVIAMPNVSVGTAEAYSWIKPKVPANKLVDVLNAPIQTWNSTLINDFEIPVIEHYPIIGQIKETLKLNGAIYTSMSGSGAAVFALFEKNTPLNLNFDPLKVLIWTEE